MFVYYFFLERVPNYCSRPRCWVSEYLFSPGSIRGDGCGVVVGWWGGGGQRHTGFGIAHSKKKKLQIHKQSA